MRLRSLAPVLICLMAIASLAASDPPIGGEALYDLYSPLFLGGGPSVTVSGAPSADALNPAANAALQRFTMEASYIALVGLGAEEGWGSVINLGASLPKPAGVWGFGLRYLTMPETLGSMPVGNVLDARATFAKDVYPNFWIGAGLHGTLGARYTQDWGVGVDLGIMHRLGDFKAFKDFHYGIVLANLGKWCAPSGEGEEATGPMNMDGAYPSPFTPKIGAGWDFFQKDWGRLSMTLDASFPFCQNAILDAGLALTIKDRVTIGTNYGINVRELIDDVPVSYYPSVYLSASFPITTAKSKDAFLAKQGWDRSELRPVIAAKPMYNDIWAFGAGAVLPFGVVDKKPPKIAVTYPETPHDQYYVSPNADGKNDELSLPVSITDERFVQDYSLRITDADGKVVREIKNKEERPENMGVKGFFDRLAYKKKGVNVPPALVWDGRSDSGQVVPDGQYHVTIESRDDNGNKGTSEEYKVAVDSTPPSVALSVPADPTGLVFSPDQDGAKDVLAVKAAGSKEDSWKVEVRDASGGLVRTMETKGAALTEVSWDGKNDAGQVVPDGVYRIVASAEDRGLNAASVTLDTVVIDPRQPPVSLSIDSGYFSPTGDGSRDALALSPGVPVKSGLAEWTIAVKNQKGDEVWSVTGKGDALKGEYAFEGKDKAGKALPEGLYRASLSARYVNGHAPAIDSPSFVLDLTPPKATVKAAASVFSPNGDGKLDSAEFDIDASQEDSWTGEVLDASGKAVAQAKLSGKPEQWAWDGTDGKGTLLPDGAYSFVVKSVDRAGNPGASVPAQVRIDTEKKSVMLSSDLKAFSPNGDGSKDALTLVASVQARENAAEWRLRVKTDAGADVRFWTGKGRVPERTVWNGKTDAGAVAPDGTYSADLWVRYQSGDEVSSQATGLVLDTKAPTVSLKADPLLFSPDGDGKKDKITIRHADSSKDGWTGTFTDAKGKAVREYSFPQAAEDVVWDGTDSAGNKLPDGRYRYLAASTDNAGNRTEKAIDGITIDTRETGAFVTATPLGFSPNGDGKFDDITFGFIVKLKDGLSAWSFSVQDESGKAQREWSGKGSSGLPTQLPWDGKDASGKVNPGKLTGVLRLSYDKGDEVEAKTPAFLLDIDPPLAKLALNPDPFSPDNDGVDDEVNISLAVQDASDIKEWKFEIFEASADDAAKSRMFMKYEGQGKPAARVTWDGKSMKGELVEAATDYPWTFTITDALGNTSRTQGVIAVDVLVIRDGNRLKIKVPSIVFRPDFADFVNLPQDTVDRNYRVVKRIAEILNKYRSYKVLIEGHANSIGKIYDYSAAKIREEEEGDVIPLSRKRAEAVKALLVENGVDAKRLSTNGLGSSTPVVDFKDADNRWKNRRVEFILEK